MSSERTNVWHKLDTYLMRTYGCQLTALEESGEGEYQATFRRFARTGGSLSFTVPAQQFRALVENDDIPPDIVALLEKIVAEAGLPSKIAEIV